MQRTHKHHNTTQPQQQLNKATKNKTHQQFKHNNIIQSTHDKQHNQKTKKPKQNTTHTMTLKQHTTNKQKRSQTNNTHARINRHNKQRDDINNGTNSQTNKNKTT